MHTFVWNSLHISNCQWINDPADYQGTNFNRAIAEGSHSITQTRKDSCMGCKQKFNVNNTDIVNYFDSNKLFCLLDLNKSYRTLNYELEQNDKSQSTSNEKRIRVNQSKSKLVYNNNHLSDWMQRKNTCRVTDVGLHITKSMNDT